MVVNAKNAEMLKAQAVAVAGRLADEPQSLTNICSASVHSEGAGVCWVVAAHDAEALISALRSDPPSQQTFEAMKENAHRQKLLFLYVLCV